jgi:16S rRNA (adenine1518-N6/adenine1519-N6)-dimethyltransferase
MVGASRKPAGGDSGVEGPANALARPQPRQASLARLAEFGIVPRRSLGQNFLIDDNILAVILQRLEARPDDVAIEVGAGLGVLTSALAGVVACVHAFEIDRKLEGPLRATLGRLAQPPSPRVILHLEDALQASLEDLAPEPTVCASNLPYSVAAPFLAEAVTRLPGIRRYCVMVQREIAERLAAAPRTKAYGGLSVWMQLHVRVVEMRPLSRAIFYPKPHVDSCLLTLDRLPAGDRDGEFRSERGGPEFVRLVIDSAFGQRRKTAVNALAAASGLRKEVLVEALAAVGAAAGVRAEELTPLQFVALAGRLHGEWPREGG